MFLIMGAPASGKSTISRALASRFERGLHVPVDELRHMVVAGVSDMSFEWSDALALQLRLARETASNMALVYSGAGFAVAIDDFWHGDTPDADYNSLGEELHRILLFPALEVTLERLSRRNPAEGEFKTVLEKAIRYTHEAIEGRPLDGWHVVDSSLLSVEETVDRIFELTEVRS